MARKRTKSGEGDFAGKIFFGGGEYNPKTDGTLEEYLTTHNGRSAFPLFRGLKYFNVMKERGWLEPRWTIVRLMWNSFRGDEHFIVTEDFQLEGMEGPAHSGREGIHAPSKILKMNGPRWEIQHLMMRREEN